ncbi:annexin [Corallococcus sp. Z5C101001]|uniref:annexin n=1 Tax=Corallococcus sp. Z5C101001 TaxID=2596829 RepID=UPI0011804100|nr:annexin [Corallococcus sp. Z5C101001]TSC34170.1 annexin [Corallococcus sp. Z5C101001]
MAIDGPRNNGVQRTLPQQPQAPAPPPPPPPPPKPPQRDRSSFERPQARTGPSLGTPTPPATANTVAGPQVAATPPAPAPTPAAPSYTQAQADKDASALREAMEGGLTGWGTDEDKLFQTLEGKSPEQLAMIRQSYQDHYGKNLDETIRGELSGSDWQRAEGMLQSNTAKSDAVNLQSEMDSLFGTNEDMLKVLEKRAPEERHAIAQQFADLNGGTAPGQTPEDFLLSRLGREMDGAQLERARSMLGAGQATNPAEATALEAQALKAGLEEDMAGWGTDEGRLFERLEKATPEQRQILAQDEGLKAKLKDDLSTEEYDRAIGMLQGNPAQADAARLREAMGGFFGADESGVRDILQGKTPDQLTAIKAEYQRQTGQSLEDQVRQWDGGDRDVTLRMLNPPAADDAQGQAEAAAEKLFLAMDGLGTDEDAIRSVLSGKSKEDLNAISAAYQQKYGKDLRSELDSELDGRDELELLKQDFDLGAIDPNDPNAAQERVRRLREVQANESGLGVSLLDGVQHLTKGESDNDILDRNLGRAEQSLQTGDTQRAQTLTGYATEDVKALQAGKDSLAETTATVAVVAVTTAAVIATGGAATPLAIAGYAAAGATTRAVTYAAIQGDAAGAQDLSRQALIGAVEGGTAVIPVGKGASAITGGTRAAATTVTEAAARTAVKETAESGVKTAIKQGMKEGAFGGAAGGAVDAATQRETWQDGALKGLGRVATRAATDGTVGAITGGAVSGGFAKGAELLKPREIPVLRNPDLPGNTTQVRYDNGRVRIEAGPHATPADIAAHQETARLLQKYEGPTGQIRQLKDRVQQALTRTPGYGTQGFESKLEVQKLKNILGGLEAAQKRIDDSIAGMSGKPTAATVAERAALQRDIANVEFQIEFHAQKLNSLAPGTGSVAMHGQTGAVPDWPGVGTTVNSQLAVTPPAQAPMNAAEHAAINNPRAPTETKAEYKARVSEGHRAYAERTYDPKLRTQAELNQDIKPGPYTREDPTTGQKVPVETNQYAKVRAEKAQAEMLRRGVIRDQQLAAAYPNGPVLDVAANDLAHGTAHNAHTVDRHGASVPTSVADAPPGARSIESRVTTGDGWNKAEPLSFQWESDATMNATLNQYVADNWPRIRTELALEGVSDNLDIPVPTGTKVGKGFKGVEDPTTGTRRAVPLDATHYNIRLRLLDGTPPQVVVLTAFPGNKNP